MKLTTPFILLIKFYKFAISPLFPASCKYYPSCSQYAIESLQKRGLITGMFLSVKRILKCNPFSSGGFDPVPLKHKNKNL
ncbi:MAG TPA: membrane protein insertion efficiency factor YidD [Ignavibacteria bacterium]|nr:membrane protein insertion efficiency factor YidD [Ignavibacteria bacterium]